jgi:energy-coupling factor transporter ATP-binding protein EcfA2
MKKQALQIRKIHVREAPGMGFGLEPLAELSPGINVIYGPNGSGKSTTLRLMQASLSPGSSNLRFRGDRVETAVDLDGVGSTVVLRDLERIPMDNNSPEIGAELARDCRFSLRELMDASSGGEYGRLFNEAAAGGLDLVQVAQSLGLNNLNNPRPKDRKDLSTLRNDLVARENEVGKLDVEKRELTRLEEEYKRLKSNVERLELLREGIRHRRKLGELEQAHIRLTDFSPCMKNLVGDELEKLKEAEEQISTALEKARRLRDAWRLEIRNRRESGLSNPVAPGLLKYLDEQKAGLDRLEHDLQSHETKRSGADAEMRAAHELLGDQVPEEFLKAAQATLLNHLEQWCDRVEEYQGKAAAIAELEQDLGDMRPIPASGASKDIQLLRDWLAADRAREKNQKLGKLLLTAALVVLVVSLVLGVFLHPAGFSGVLGAAVLGLAWHQLRKGREEDCRREAEEKCQQTPDAWTRPAVNHLLEQRGQKYAEELERQQRITRWTTVLTNRRNALGEDFQKLAEDGQELSEKLGFTPRISSKSFGMVARALIAWQEAFRKSSAATEAVEQSRNSVHDLRIGIEAKFADFTKQGLAHDFHSADLAGWIAELRDRDQRFQNACRGLKSARSEVSMCLGAIRTARNQIAEIFEKIAPNPPDEASLRELLQCLADYRSAGDEVAAFGHSKSEAQKFFHENPDLAGRALEAMESEVEEIGDPNNRLNEVNQEIGAIKERLRSARNSTDVEDSLVEFENVQTALQIEREQMLARFAGMALAQQVQSKVASETVPTVQRRAGELLRVFTRGSCELHVTTDGIKALQPAQGQRRFELDELSDGTRAQLFIAVRLAFVEQGEKGLRLPLFFDEAFANADTERGRKIMESLLEISRQGRQIFFFTSQPEEFGRWRDMLSGHCENKARLLTIRKGFPQPNVQAGLRPPDRYPKPLENESYREYSERIEVWRQMDPWIASIDEVPIVPLLENPGDLHMLLESDIHAWGPLARLGPQECVLEGGETAFEKARRKAAFLHGVCIEWQRGRGRPITRGLLDQAGATNTRLEEVWAYAEGFGRDAGRLCNAFERKEISVAQFGAGRIAKLREFCEENGMIVPGQPFDEGELRLRVANLGRNLGLSAEESGQLMEFFTTTP